MKEATTMFTKTKVFYRISGAFGELKEIEKQRHGHAEVKDIYLKWFNGKNFHFAQIRTNKSKLKTCFLHHS